MSAADTRAADGAGRPASVASVFAAIAPIYLAFGAILGFAQAGLPVILASEGRPVESVGWVFLLYLPVGLSFLWASFVDRHNLPFPLPRAGGRRGGRRGWIVAMQSLAALILLLVATGREAAAPMLFAAGLASATAIATMDIALEALVIETVPAHRRPAVAALKIAAACLGGILGGGALVWCYDWLGWTGSHAALALMLLASVLPMSLLAPFGSTGAAPGNRAASLWKALRTRRTQARLLLLFAASAAVGAAFGLNRIALVDLGVERATIGLVAGTLAPLAGAAAAALTGLVLARIGRGRTLLSLVPPALLTIAAMVGSALRPELGTAVPIAATILGFAVTCAFAVILGTVIIAWSDGPQAGTDFALQYGLSNTAATLALFAAAQTAGLAGWAIYLGAAGGAFVLVLVCFERIAAALDRPGSRLP